MKICVDDHAAIYLTFIFLTISPGVVSGSQGGSTSNALEGLHAVHVCELISIVNLSTSGDNLEQDAGLTCEGFSSLAYVILEDL